MVIVAFDTSMSIFSVAIVREDGVVASYAAEGKGSRNEKLLPSIDWMLSEAGIERTTIDRLVVTRGPGSFTGVRIGLAMARGIGFSLDRPVTALSSHEAALGASVGKTLVFSDALRGERYVTGFDGGIEILPSEVADAERFESLSRDYPRAVDLEELIQRENLAVLAARRALWLEEQGRLPADGDATPLYVRLAEAEVRLRQRQE
ncbi:MAG TPA: tRNA (adenosine(37)-N6)-threonylcarbamoyltransferase complex dimerization subunit type 1 TsaB [Thermoanaerobaculia bacterium]|nr:tRNA (adenosine(37)-N6)-threonylcarbamoyltransferase complex dimerization subunit type 1 TsaB [Thermoanaerobaculia bacterium]